MTVCSPFNRGRGVSESTPTAESHLESRAAFLDLTVQAACLVLLAYWSFILVQPFATIIVWSIVLTVVLHPIFAWLTNELRVPAVLAALLITAFNLVVLLGPTTWLGLSLIETVRSFAERLGTGEIAVPPPPEYIKGWPLIGESSYDFWLLASINLKVALNQIAPQLKPMRTDLLGMLGDTGLGMLKFIVSVIVSGFLLLPGRRLGAGIREIFRHITAEHGDEFVDLTGATIRNLARGIIGVAIVQALLAGIGFMIAGVPAAGFLGFLVLLFGFVQIDAAVVILPVLVWAWMKMDTSAALIFTAYMVPVGLLNNFLRPSLMAHGLKTPVVVIFIGVIGGLLAQGVIGLFVGPIVLAIAWEVLKIWTSRAMGGPQMRSPLAPNGD